VFGKARDKGIAIAGLEPKAVTLGADGAVEADLAVHDETSPHGGLAYVLAQIGAPDFPVPLGVFRAVEAPTYEDLYAEQAAAVTARRGKGDLAALLHGGHAWEIR
jgi:2-oxoglutarate ferredoxin oxidoreductase subunit beta